MTGRTRIDGFIFYKNYNNNNNNKHTQLNETKKSK